MPGICNDLLVVMQCLRPGGVTVFDDVTNEKYPDVAAGWNWLK